MATAGENGEAKRPPFVVSFKADQRERLHTLRALGLLSAESSADVARMLLDKFIEDLAARNNLTVLDLDRIGERLAAGAPADALKRIGAPEAQGKRGERR